MRVGFAVLASVAACSTTKPVSLAPHPAGVREYLERHPASALLVTDSAGRARWIHEPRVDGDTLRGRRSPTLPREQAAISLAAIREIAAPRFSAGRTLGLIGGLAAAVGAIALLLPGATY